MGELANETRCFKFWSLKGPSDQETILAEYVDGIHFILSLGNEQDFIPEVPSGVLICNKEDVTEQFTFIIRRYISEFQHDIDMRQHSKRCLLNIYILGELLGFSAADVEKAYVSKNEVNYERQKQGY